MEKSSSPLGMTVGTAVADVVGLSINSSIKDGKSGLKLPNLDWETIEQKFQNATLHDPQHAQQLPSRKKNDGRREEILRKLAMSSPDDDYASVYKKPLKNRMPGNLELCIMNELDEGGAEGLYEAPSSSAWPPQDSEVSSVFVSQNQLHEEASKAFAKAKSIAHVLLEEEKQKMLPRSNLAQIISMVSSSVCEELHMKGLVTMNLARLQVLYNAMHSEIEALNNDLVELLMERDELCMRKDSLLLDIEDLQQRVKELQQRQII